MRLARNNLQENWATLVVAEVTAMTLSCNCLISVPYLISLSAHSYFCVWISDFDVLTNKTAKEWASLPFLVSKCNALIIMQVYSLEE